jgi:hypothetical protein
MTPLTPYERKQLLKNSGVTEAEINEYEQLLQERHALIACDVEPQMQLEPAKARRLTQLFWKLYPSAKRFC